MRPPIHKERWFIMPMQSWPEESRRTVLAGKPIGANRLVAVFDTAEEAEAAVREHNAALNENDAASAGTDPRLDPNSSTEGSVMDASEDIITAMGTSSDRLWSDDTLANIVGLPLLVEPTDAQFPRHHPVFELEVSDILRRRRDTTGAYTGGYEVVRFEYAIRRRDPASIGALIASHRALVEAHEDLFSEDGEPLVPEEEVAACYAREQDGLRSLLAAPCRTLHDASLKAAYLRENFDLGDLAMRGEFEAFLGSLISERRA